MLELLPWYAGGKTTAEESAAIERKLQGNPQLQAELRLVRQEKQVSVESVKALGEPSPDLLDKMLGQLDGVRQLPKIARDPKPRRSPAFSRACSASRRPRLCASPWLRLRSVIVAESAALLKLSGAEPEAAYRDGFSARKPPGRSSSCTSSPTPSSVRSACCSPISTRPWSRDRCPTAPS